MEILLFPTSNSKFNILDEEIEDFKGEVSFNSNSIVGNINFDSVVFSYKEAFLQDLPVLKSDTPSQNKSLSPETKRIAVFHFPLQSYLLLLLLSLYSKGF